MAPKPKRFSLEGQRYLATGFTGHWTRDDRYVELVRYESHCATCGRWFEARTTKTRWHDHQVNRRCEEHRSMGVPVKLEKKLGLKRAARRKRVVELVPSLAPADAQPSYLD